MATKTAAKKTAPSLANFGRNIEASIDGSVLTMKIDLSKNLGASSSGKNLLVATTNGNVEVPNGSGIKLGLNAYKPK